MPLDPKRIPETELFDDPQAGERTQTELDQRLMRSPSFWRSMITTPLRYVILAYLLWRLVDWLFSPPIAPAHGTIAAVALGAGTFFVLGMRGYRMELREEMRRKLEAEGRPLCPCGYCLEGVKERCPECGRLRDRR